MPGWILREALVSGRAQATCSRKDCPHYCSMQALAMSAWQVLDFPADVEVSCRREDNEDLIGGEASGQGYVTRAIGHKAMEFRGLGA